MSSCRGYYRNETTATARNVGIAVSGGAVATPGAGDARKLHSYLCNNTHSATVFLQIFDVRAANVTLGTTLPVVTIPLPPGVSGGLFQDLQIVDHTTTNPGLSYAVTSTATGSSNPGAAVDVNLIWS